MLRKKSLWIKWIILPAALPILGGIVYLLMGHQKQDPDNAWNPKGACWMVADRVQDFYWTHGRLPVNYAEIRESILATPDKNTPSPDHTFTWELRNPMNWGDPSQGDRDIHVRMINTRNPEEFVPWMGTPYYDWAGDFHLTPLERVWTIHQRHLPSGEYVIVNNEVNLAHTMAMDIDSFIRVHNYLPTLDDYPARSINPLTRDLGEMGAFNEFTFWVEGEVSSGTINVASMVSGRIYQYPLRPGPHHERRPRIIEPEF